MKYILIVVFLAVIAAAAVTGYHKGFLKTLVSMLAILISAVFVFFLSGPVTDLLSSKTGLRESIRQSVYEKLMEKAEEDGAVTDEEQRESAAESFIPKAVLESFNSKTNPFGSREDYITDLSAHIASLTMKAIGIIITLVLSFILIRVLISVSGLLNKLPLLGGINRVLGAALGLVKGLLIIWCLCFAMNALSSTSIGQSCLEAVNESRILSLFYNGALSLQGLLGSF